MNNLVGQKFNKLIVICRENIKDKSGSYFYKCRCECGNYVSVRSSNIKKGLTKSCGCLRIERNKNRKFSLKRNETHLKMRYGLSIKEYNNLLNKQDNKCAICKEKFVISPAIDHDHNCCAGKKTCGKCIRGLLCLKCNTSLGGFNDDINILKSAIDYLDSYRGKDETRIS